MPNRLLLNKYVKNKKKSKMLTMLGGNILYIYQFYIPALSRGVNVACKKVKSRCCLCYIS